MEVTKMNRNVLKSHGVFAASGNSGNYGANIITYLRKKHDCIYIIRYWEHEWTD